MKGRNKLSNNYDLVILGGGIGGYVAAIRAAQLGLKTALVEKEKLGGTCLHHGCIPSKALLRSAEVFALAKRADQFGVKTESVSLDFPKVQLRKEAIVNKLYEGIQYLMKKGEIDIYKGMGRILGPSIFSPLPGAISVEMNDGSESKILIPEHLLIATGSRSRKLDGLNYESENVITSKEALNFQSLPKSIMIIGGGIIGIEWASMLVDFGTTVTIIEQAERILVTEDEEIAQEAHRLLTQKGVTIITNADVRLHTRTTEDKVTIQVEHDDQVNDYSAEKLLVSVGREAVTNDIGLKNTAITLVDGFIETNEHYQTAESHIYAIGDCIGGLQLAHVAAYEGITAVEHLAGCAPDNIDYEQVPRCIYSSPEIASIGFTEKEAEEKGYKLKIGRFPFNAVGKSLVFGETDGFVKIIADAETDDLLGIHMIGPNVTDLISEAGLAKVLDATPWEISQTIHPHPSLTEAFAEAALSVNDRPIHL